MRCSSHMQELQWRTVCRAGPTLCAQQLRSPGLAVPLAHDLCFDLDLGSAVTLPEPGALTNRRQLSCAAQPHLLLRNTLQRQESICRGFNCKFPLILPIFRASPKHFSSTTPFHGHSCGHKIFLAFQDNQLQLLTFKKRY